MVIDHFPKFFVMIHIASLSFDFILFSLSSAKDRQKRLKLFPDIFSACKAYLECFQYGMVLFIQGDNLAGIRTMTGSTLGSLSRHMR